MVRSDLAEHTDTTACPPIPAYTQADGVRAAAELALLPQNSVIERMLEDYGVIRKQLRACQ